MMCTDPSPSFAAGHESSERREVANLLRALHEHAIFNADPRLHLAVDALQRVHALYDGYGGPADRGTPQQQAQVAIHNAIVDAFEAHTGSSASRLCPAAPD